MKKETYKNLYRVTPRQGRANYLRLDMNENPEGLPDDFVEAVLHSFTPAELATYPETGRLCKKLAEYIDVAPNQILPVNGSDDAIKLIFEVFGDPGRKLISVWPTFAMYKVYSQMMNMNHVQIPYGTDFSVNVQDIISAIDESTSIVSLLNPNNPIGNVYEEDDVISIVKKAETVNAIVIIDEAYHYFYDKTFINICKKSSNVILLRTFSKLCSIAGLRIGYAVSTPELIQLLFNAQPSYSVNVVALRFAEEIISRPDLIRRLIEIEKEGRNYITQKLSERGIPYYEKNGNYVFIYCGEEAEIVARSLEEKNVLVKTYLTDPMLRKYIRISTGSKKAMELFWSKFSEVRGLK